MIFNDMDQWREALSKCHLDEAIMPTSRGYLIENVECYNKIQKILNSPEMENCHKYLYELDVEDLQEDEIQKVDKLYELGKNRGFIEADDEETDECDICGDDTCQDPTSHDAVAMPTVVPPPPPPPPALKTCAYTVMYSAMKDGEIKTGEAYSNSISPRSAKADVLAKLMQLGYDNVSILAIEASDPDCVGNDVPEDKPASFVPPAVDAHDITAFEADTLDEKAKDEDAEAADDKDAKDDAKDEKAKDEDAEAADDEDAENADSEEDSAEDNKDDDEAKADDKADDEKSKDDKDDELDDTQKNQLKDQYKKTFKAAMLKCKFEKSFDELNIDEKVKLFTELSKTWKNKNDPSEFMTAKEMESLNKTVIKR